MRAYCATLATWSHNAWTYRHNERMSDASRRTHYEIDRPTDGLLTRMARKLEPVEIEATKVTPNWCYRDDRNNEFVFVPHVHAHDSIRKKPGLFERIVARLKFWPDRDPYEIPGYLRHQKD